ncbi:MAG: tetratricopeptide repeat protein [Terriglobales bacterium]
MSTSVSILLLSVLSFAQSDFRRSTGHTDNGSVVVSVRDGLGQPVVDARVEVRDRQSGPMPKGGYTNASGTVELMGVTYGHYDVVVTKGLLQAAEALEVRAMGVAVNVRLGNAEGSEVGGKTTVSVAQYKVPGKARKELEKARKAMSERKLDEARERVEKALAIYPKFSDALTTRAILRMDKLEFEAASADLDLALEYDSVNAVAYLVYGACLNQQSKFDLAIQTLERGIALDPLAWQGYFEMGKAQVGKKNYPQAIKYLDKAQAVVNFEYPPLHLVKAHALLASKDYALAMAELQIFLDKSPQDPRSEDARKTLEQVRAYVQRD